MYLVSEFQNMTAKCLSTEERKKKFIIDNDAGGDDAMAIFLALLYEKYYDGPKLLALTTGNGNTTEDNVYYNNQRILRVAKRQDVPIYRGSKASLVTTPVSSSFYGNDGLGDITETMLDLVPAKTEDAVTALINYSKTYEGDEYPNAEFNARMDVEAYHIVAQNATPDKVTVLPFSQVMEYLDFSKDWRENVLGGIDTDIMKALNEFEKVGLAQKPSWHALDPATVALFLKPDLVAEYKFSKHGIIAHGEKRGINTNEFVEKEEANVRIVYSFKTEQYKAFLLNVFF